MCVVDPVPPNRTDIAVLGTSVRGKIPDGAWEARSAIIYFAFAPKPTRGAGVALPAATFLRVHTELTCAATSGARQIIGRGSYRALFARCRVISSTSIKTFRALLTPASRGGFEPSTGTYVATS